MEQPLQTALDIIEDRGYVRAVAILKNTAPDKLDFSDPLVGLAYDFEAERLLARKLARSG